MLEGLQVSVMQELKLCTERTSNELLKVMIENIDFHLDYNRVTMEMDEVA
jgi:hypothetical protein